MTVLKPSINILVVNPTQQDVTSTPRYDKVSSPAGLFGMPMPVVKPVLISISFGLAVLTGAFTPHLTYYLERIMVFGF